MKLFKKKDLQEVFDTLQQFNTTFITFDGVIHTGVTYNYANKDGLLCTVEEYLMNDIKNDGYIQENNKKTMYPLSSIVSVEFNLLDEIKVKKIYDESQGVFFDMKDIEKLKISK